MTAGEGMLITGFVLIIPLICLLGGMAVTTDARDHQTTTSARFLRAAIALGTIIVLLWIAATWAAVK